jgi:hypothetical protein
MVCLFSQADGRLSIYSFDQLDLRETTNLRLGWLSHDECALTGAVTAYAAMKKRSLRAVNPHFRKFKGTVPGRRGLAQFDV